MRQIYFDNNAVNTIFMLSMCFVSVLSVHQHQQQQQLQHIYDENSSRFAASSKASIANDNANSQETWQPMSQNNWIILKTAPRNDAAATITPLIKPANNHRDTYGNRNSHSLAAPQPQLSYQYWHKEQQAYPSSQLQTNYYTYNQNISSSGDSSSSNSNNAGNYQQPTATDVKLIEPYIVTISKMRARTDSLSKNDAILKRRISNSNSKHAFSAATPYVGGIKLPKDVVSNVVATPKIEFQQDIEKKHNNTQHNFAVGFSNKMKATTLVDVDNNDDDAVADDAQHDNIVDGAQLNEILLPLQSTLDKIISFCDMAKRFISDVDASDNDTDNDDDDADDGDGNDDETNMNTINDAVNSDDLQRFINAKPTALTTLKEVQGHHGLSMKPSTTATSSIQAQSRASTALSSIGTGRKRVKKLKKKLSKFILPLLLAYKLKFLTLIPVLIGGLTLLVGTTGLAGFFFALFTAVMSLKSTGSSKSIIVKKI